jgi:hypothetical protein
MSVSYVQHTRCTITATVSSVQHTLCTITATVSSVQHARCTITVTVSSVQHIRWTITATVSQFSTTNTMHICYCQSVPSNTHDAPQLLLTKSHAQQMNPKHSTLAEHNSVPCSLWLGARASGMIPDSRWRYFDVQMLITRRFSDIPDIKMLTLPPPRPPPKPLKICSVFCIFPSSIQAYSIELFQCYR